MNLTSAFFYLLAIIAVLGAIILYMANPVLTTSVAISIIMFGSGAIVASTTAIAVSCTSVVYITQPILFEREEEAYENYPV